MYNASLITKVPNLKITQKGLLLVSLPIVVQIVLLFVLGHLLNLSEQQTTRLDRYRVLMAHASGVSKLIYDAGNALVLLKLTNNETAVDRYSQLAAEIKTDFAEMSQLISEFPQHRETLNRVQALADEALVISDQTLLELSGAVALDPNTLAAQRSALVAISADYLAEVQGFIKRLEETEKVTPEGAARLKFAVQLSLAAALITGMLAIASAFWFFRGMAARLSILTENTVRVAEKKPLQEQLNGNDEIAQLDRFFRQMVDALAVAEAYKRQLVGVVSHELRTPLSSVSVFFEMMGSEMYGKLPPQLVQHGSSAGRSVKRLIGLINELLDIDKMEAGQMEMQFCSLRVSEWLVESIDTIKDLADHRKVVITVDGPDPIAYADRERMIQVLVNLLSNAIKYSPPASQVTIRVAELSEAVEIRVIDQGEGIPQDQLSKLFQKFSQIGKNENSGIKGTGLGLAICKAIVEQHGGVIGLESQPGRGSEFWFRVPKEASSSLQAPSQTVSR